MAFLSQQFFSRWIAGDTIDAALLATRKENREGKRVLLNVMGEHARTKVLVEQAVGMYLEVLEETHKLGLEADVSVKLTHLGLDVGKGYCLRKLLEIVERAHALNIDVWIDMEAPRYAQDTIDLYLEVYKQFKNVAVTLQANLERTREDLNRVLQKNGRVRLVKGAYVGDYQRDQTEEVFSRLLRVLFSTADRFAIATNDEALIDEAVNLNARYNRSFEFQFLRGVKRGVARKLARKHAVAIYTPFGTNVLAYAWRRLKERPSQALMLFS